MAKVNNSAGCSSLGVGAPPIARYSAGDNCIVRIRRRGEVPKLSAACKIAERKLAATFMERKQAR